MSDEEIYDLISCRGVRLPRRFPSFFFSLPSFFIFLFLFGCFLFIHLFVCLFVCFYISFLFEEKERAYYGKIAFPRRRMAIPRPFFCISSESCRVDIRLSLPSL